MTVCDPMLKFRDCITRITLCISFVVISGRDMGSRSAPAPPAIASSWLTRLPGDEAIEKGTDMVWQMFLMFWVVCAGAFGMAMTTSSTFILWTISASVTSGPYTSSPWVFLPIFFASSSTKATGCVPS